MTVPESDIAGDIIAAMPPVSEHVVSAQLSDQPSVDQPPADQPPIDQPAAKRRRGRPRKNAGPTTVTSAGIDSQLGINHANDEIPAPGPGTDSKIVAAIATDCIINIGRLIGGDEWAPVKSEGIDERENLINSFTLYFDANGIVDIPPGVALAIAIGGYAIPRVTMPTTSSRLKRWGGAVKGWFRGLFGRRVALPSDSGSIRA